jgi:hypothetical protein
MEDLPQCLGGSSERPVYVSFDQRSKQITLNPLMKHALEVSVKSGDTVSWDFRVHARDVRFEVLFCPGDTTAKTLSIVESQLLAWNQPSFKGTYTSQCTGIFAIVFDNTISSWFSKMVSYQVHVATDQTQKKSL